MNRFHRFTDGLRALVAYWSPNMTASQFLVKGTLSPEEFVDAGELLVFKFPTWRWQSADGKRQVPWLPPSKQCLVTHNVPCRSRIDQLDSLWRRYAENDEEWFLPGNGAKATVENSRDELETIDLESLRNRIFDDENEVNSNVNPTTSSSGSTFIVTQKERHVEEGYTKIVDLSIFNSLDENLMEDYDLAAASSSSHLYPSSWTLCNADIVEEVAVATEILKTRSYDISITYDKYYQCPRIWLFGYDEHGVPLTPPQVFQDILSDYISKTVTVDPHPSTGIPTVSIHPCKHASVMQKVVNYWISKNIEPRHDLTLLVLLKLIASVVPTIEYDFTTDIDMSLLP